MEYHIYLPDPGLSPVLDRTLCVGDFGNQVTRKVSWCDLRPQKGRSRLLRRCHGAILKDPEDHGWESLTTRIPVHSPTDLPPDLHVPPTHPFGPQTQPSGHPDPLTPDLPTLPEGSGRHQRGKESYSDDSRTSSTRRSLGARTPDEKLPPGPPPSPPERRTGSHELNLSFPTRLLKTDHSPKRPK